MKKALSIILAILMIATAVPMASASSYDEEIFTSGDYSYYIEDDGSAVICDYTGTETNLVIPAQIDGYDVSIIDPYTFQGNDFIETAVVSEGILRVGGDAFDSCASLKNIVFPDSVIELGYNCNFGTINNCPELESVTIGKGLRIFRGTELSECPKLKEIIIDEENPYLACEDLVVYSKNRKTLVSFLDYNAESFTVPDSVRVIGSEAFCGSDIKEIKLNDGLLYIAYFAFYSCNNLTDIVFPGSLQLVGRFIFRNCASLTNVTLSEGLANISDGMFDKCLNLKNVYVPAGLESVNEEAFYNWTYENYGTKVPEINFWYGGNEEQWAALEVDTLDTVPNVYYNHTHSYDCTDTYAVCDECGLTYSNNHAWKQTELVYPENGNDGYIDFVCLTDSSHTKREILSADTIDAENFYTIIKEMERLYTKVDWVDSMKEALAEEYELSLLSELEYIYGEFYSHLEISLKDVDEYFGEAIESGMYTKPDYTEYDELVDCIEKAIAEGNLDPAKQTELDEIKAVIDEIRADGENTKAEYQAVVDEYTTKLQEIKAEITEPEIPEEPAEDNVCEDCGKVHDGFFSEIICFITKIINFIKNLFA